MRSADASLYMWFFFLQTVRALLNETLRVIPDSVLDSLPQLETPPDSLLADLGSLPLAPSLGSVEPFLEHSASQYPRTEILVNGHV